jgi:hypothetical protein
MRFPELKTGSVSQYPGCVAVVRPLRVMQFLDGTEQRFARRGRARRRWQVQLERLDEGEMALVNRFLAAQQGGAQEFAFTDPLSGQEFARCRLEGPDSALRWSGPHGGSLESLLIEECE